MELNGLPDNSTETIQENRKIKVSLDNVYDTTPIVIPPSNNKIVKLLKGLCPKFILNFYVNHIYDHIFHLKNKLRYAKLIKYTARHYKSLENELKKQSDKKLKVGFYVEYDASFSAYELFKLMLEDKFNFSPKIVIIPDVTRGKDNLINQYKHTKEYFIKLYGAENILDGYDINTDAYLDLSDQFDIINLANPYDFMVHKYHSIRYLCTKNVLTFYISYGCMPDNYGCKKIMPLLEMSLFWKVFADNRISYKDYKKNELASGRNVVCYGYAKMDSLAKIPIIPHDKKTIIIAVHHTVNNPELPLSTFLLYSDFILELPKKYPDINFIFRPHPLLFVNLLNDNIWTNEQIDEYKQKLDKNGITYSSGGNYFDIFANSDAIIHDCSSFLVEYLYTGKPCCFMAKSNYKKVFSKLGFACLKNYYMAFNKQQIIDFIDEVIINGIDVKKASRIKFAEKHLKLNYPDVSKIILQDFNNLACN